ncbi:MAG: imidazolonepropionase-like amidohydrolase [Polaribacter sp.]|jgi:imidazolonepropionase-like amidohydrolase
MIKNNYFRVSFLLLFFVTMVSQIAYAQITFPRNGVYDDRAGHYAFTNATIHKTVNQKLEKATLIIKEGRIVAVGTGISIPETAIVIDLEGKHIYPSFIDMYTSYGLPKRKRKESDRRRGEQQMVSEKEGAYSWNEALRPEFQAHEHFTIDKKEAKAFRKLGFGTVLTHQMDGISRGSSVAVLLGDDNEHEVVLKDKVMHHLSFKKGVSRQNYPGSLMGGIALLRQTYMDGDWYKRQGDKEEYNISLAAWNEMRQLPQVFEVRDKLEILRAEKIAKEFGLKYTYIGSGDEYKRLEDIKRTGATIIVNLNFPKAYDVEDPIDALRASLADLKHWELAPTNPARLAKAGIPIVLTTHKLKKKTSFMEQLRKAIKNGLSEDVALKALTEAPAQMIGIYDQVGSIEKGKRANFLITSGKIFDEKTKIHHNWVNGKAHTFKDLDKTDLTGIYDFKVGSEKYILEVTGKAGKESMAIRVNDSTEIKVKHSYKDKLIQLSFSPSKKEKGVITLSGSASEKKWSGKATDPKGEWMNWIASYTGAAPEKKKKEEGKGEKKEDKSDKEKTADEDVVGTVVYPFMAYGWETAPKAESFLFKNATVWTNEKDGILENTDVLIQNGKITRLGKGLKAKGAIEVDASGKHLTCGIIDEHSHIAISRGVNECTQSSTAEVSIADVINSEDINIYRQLSGGVTTSQLLHGSCNPIGGQSAIIKLRWGYAPEQMKFDNVDGFIKFALGENVKRSSSPYNNRFPDSRMGVEQVYVDAFTRAKAYEEEKKIGGASFRKDLDMEALVEILNKERFITCHSYVQSEINMLMKVADMMGFRVNTFTHILEGYKLADKMKAHGAGGSTFSDWWGYKFEVIDAIPYNAALLNEQGVVTALNSDDAEMARRLNQEAAKAMMYGDVSEEDAWKMVTLNPAKLLHIDDRVGSIKKGKDADVVLWSDHPMSIYAKAEMTLIDGIRFFDRTEDKAMRKTIAMERSRLIQKMLDAKNGGEKTGPMPGKKPKHYHCDDAEDEMVN